MRITHVQGQMQIRSNQQKNTIHPYSRQNLAQDFNTKPHTKIQIGQQTNHHGYSIFKYPMELNRRGMARIFSSQQAHALPTADSSVVSVGAALCFKVHFFFLRDAILKIFLRRDNFCPRLGTKKHLAILRQHKIFSCT